MATLSNERSEEYFRDEIQKIRNQYANPNGIADFKAGLLDNLNLVKKYLTLPNLSAEHKRTYEEYLDEAEKLEWLDDQTKGQLKALKQSMNPNATNNQPATSPLSPPNLNNAPQAPIDSLKSITTAELSKDLASFKAEFEKIQALPDVTQYAGWAIFFTKLTKEWYDISFSNDPKKVTLWINNDTKGTPQEIRNKKIQLETQILTYLEANPNTRKNILKWLLLQDGIFKSYIEVNSIGWKVQINSISVAEFRTYITTQNKTNTAAGKSISAYDDTILREAATVFPTQTELNTSIQSVLIELQKRWAIDVNAPNTPLAPPADLRDSFGGNLSLPSSPLVLAGGWLLYGLFKKEWGFLQWLKYGFIGVLVAIFWGMGSDWLKKNLGYDLGFTLGEQKVGLMKLEKKVNDLRGATGENSKLTASEMSSVKALVGEFDSKWKNEPSVSPTWPAISDMLDGKLDVGKRLTDSPELNAYEERVNLYYLRAWGGIDSAELAKRLKDVEVKLGKAKASSTSGASTAGAWAGWAAVTPATGPTSSIDVSKLAPSQKKMYESFKDNPGIKKYIDNIIVSDPTENGDIWQYATFIFSDAFQNQKLESITYTAADRDMFHNTKMHSFSIQKPPVLNTMILKRILRLGLLGNHNLSMPAAWTQEGDKEKADFIAKYPEDQWKPKTLAELIQEVHK